MHIYYCLPVWGKLLYFLLPEVCKTLMYCATVICCNACSDLNKKTFSATGIMLFRTLVHICNLHKFLRDGDKHYFILGTIRSLECSSPSYHSYWRLW